jgi:asparagine synthase (glutamine-hydrolysing)
MRHYSWYANDSFVDQERGVALGRVSLGFVDTAAQPACNEDGSLQAVMDGELFDYDDQRRVLAAQGHRFQSTSHAEVLLHGYESSGRRFFASLHGHYSAVIWDTVNQCLLALSDRFGLKPLYYVQSHERLLVASEIKALLRSGSVPHSLNHRGIAQFFTYGHYFGCDTSLQAVRLLPAATCLTYDVVAGRVKLDRYWRLGESGLDVPPKRVELLNRIDEAFCRSVDRCSHGVDGLGLSLSGGLDARTILGAIDHRQTAVKTVSIGMAGSMDHRSAAEMAAVCKCPHKCIELNDNFLKSFETHLERMVLLTDGQYLSQCIVMPTLPMYREMGIKFLLRGHAGELMHMCKAYNYSLDNEALNIRDDGALEAWCFRRLQAYMLGELRAPLFRRQSEIEEMARDSLWDALAEHAGVGPPISRMWHLFLTQRLRRETVLSLVKFGSLMHVRVPYLDNELVDLLLAAPPELKLGDEIQSHILRRRKPEFLKIINANTGAPLQSGQLRQGLATLRMKICARLGVPGYQPYERLGLWLRRELRPVVTRLLLSDSCLDRDLFNPDAVSAAVDDHLEGRRNHTFLLMALMVFEIGQRNVLSEAIGASDIPHGRGMACRK